jgi:hypothetical protein
VALSRSILALLLALAACEGSVSSPGGDPDPTRPTDPSTCIPGVPGTSRIPRLTNAQYDHTIQDLLRLEVTPSAMLAPDTTGSLDDRGWDAYRASAERLASQASGDPTSRAAIVPCAPTGDGAACAHETIVAFGRRAFRRPLTEEEVLRFDDLYARRAELTAAGTFDEGIELVLEAFLQSPSFLMRAEISTERMGSRVVLSPHEVASRLSYMLWDSMPDDALFAAADRGELTTAEQIRAQAMRMLDLPRARSMVAAFHRRWLGIDGSDAARWSDIVRDEERFDRFTPALVPLFREETERFVEEVVFERDGGLTALLTTPVGFVNRDLAPLYDLDPSGYGDALEPVELDPAQRSGILTRVGFLASHAMFDRTSPILRGAYIQKHLLCLELGNPPPGAEMTPLPPPDPSLRTTRDRVALQTSNPACAICHADYINPVGFAFEHYDAIGAWRDTENDAPIDAAATAPIGGEELEFDGAMELSAAIAAATPARICYAQQWVEYAYRRAPNSQDRCVTEDLAQKLSDDGYSVRDLLVDLTQSDVFRYRAPEVTP